MFKRGLRPYRTPAIDLGPSEARDRRAHLASQRQIREPLSTGGAAFLAQMTSKVSLAHTAKDFPHVINKLSPLGYKPSMMIKALDRLLIDDRPERQGFPFDIVLELGKLRDLYSRYLKA